MRKVLEAYNFDVSNLFNLPDEEESGADYGRYIQSSKEYKDLVKLMKKYNIEGDTQYKISVGSGHFRARLRHPLGVIDMDETGYTFSPKRNLKLMNGLDLSKYSEGFAQVKSFCDQVMNLGLEDMDSPLDY